VLALPGVGAGIGALFVTMTLFGGMFFALALHLQGGLGDSPLRAGLTFAPSAVAFAVVSLNWQRLPERVREWLPIAGFAGTVTGLLVTAGLLRGAGEPVAMYFSLALVGASLALAFSPLMTSVLMRVPVSQAADATGVLVTVNQLGLVLGVASFGTLYLDLAGALPGQSGTAAFRHLSAHAITLTFLVLAVAAAAGGLIAAARALAFRPAMAAGARPQPVPVPVQDRQPS
jgi:hypothetical protein